MSTDLFINLCKYYYYFNASILIIIIIIIIKEDKNTQWNEAGVRL